MKLKLLSLIALASMSASSMAHEPFEKKLVFVGDTEYSSFCKAAIKDDVSLMRRSFSKKVGVVAVHKKEVYEVLLSEENLSCNGLSIIEFSEQRKAGEVLSYLNSIKQTI